MSTDRMAILFSLVLLSACGGSPGDPRGAAPGERDVRVAPGAGGEEREPRPDQGGPADGTGGPGDREEQAPPPVKLPAGWSINPEPPASGCAPAVPCIDAYLALPAKLGRARVTTRAKVDALASEIARTSSPDAPAEAPQLPLEELQTILTDGVGLGGLLPTGAPAVVVHDRFAVDGVRVQRLLLEDPLLGAIDAVMAIASEPRGIVLGLHGHGEAEDSFLLERHGLALARAGWTVVAPRLRAYQDGGSESEASYFLMEHGMTLMGAEIAESLRWLRWIRGQHAEAPIVIGHSGGAAIALFATIVDPTVRGVIVDGTPQLTNWAETGIADETLPGLVPHRWALTTLERSFVPTRSLPDELNADLPLAAVLSALDSLDAP